MRAIGGDLTKRPFFNTESEEAFVTPMQGQNTKIYFEEKNKN